MPYYFKEYELPGGPAYCAKACRKFVQDMESCPLQKYKKDIDDNPCPFPAWSHCNDIKISDWRKVAEWRDD